MNQPEMEKEKIIQENKYEKFDFFKGVNHFTKKENIKAFVKSLAGRMILTASFVGVVIYGLGSLGMSPDHEYYQYRAAQKIEQQKQEELLKEQNKALEQTPGQNTQNTPGENI